MRAAFLEDPPPLAAAQVRRHRDRWADAPAHRVGRAAGRRAEASDARAAASWLDQARVPTAPYQGCCRPASSRRRPTVTIGRHAAGGSDCGDRAGTSRAQQKRRRWGAVFRGLSRERVAPSA
jgi:hypothetical protein